MQLSPLSCSGLQRETERGAVWKGGKGGEQEESSLIMGARKWGGWAHRRTNGLMRLAESCLPSNLISGQNYFSAAFIAVIRHSCSPRALFSVHSASPFVFHCHANTKQLTHKCTCAHTQTRFVLSDFRQIQLGTKSKLSRGMINTITADAPQWVDRRVI